MALLLWYGSKLAFVHTLIAINNNNKGIIMVQILNIRAYNLKVVKPRWASLTQEFGYHWSEELLPSLGRTLKGKQLCSLLAAFVICV